MSNTDKKKNKVQVAFAALNPYLEETSPLPIQKEVAGRDYVPYGRFNEYPHFLLDLYEHCSTLKAIIDGNVNFVCGDAITFDGLPASEELADRVASLARDWYIFGYAFLRAIRNPFGEVISDEYLQAEYVRTDKDRQSFWYSEKWNTRGSWKSVVWPAFLREQNVPSSVLMLGSGRGIYPSPIWSAAIKDVMMEQKIEEFHLSELENNFTSSAIVNFCSGVPSDTEKADIERNINEKFSGSANAGRLLLSFSESVANRTTIDRLQSDSFDARYQALSKRVREMIYCSFKAQPILFGLTSETNTGFSTNEFTDLFNLYNKVMISPVQDMLKRAFRKVYGRDCLNITPFTI